MKDGPEKPPLSLQLYNFKTLGFSLYFLLIHFQIKEPLAWQYGPVPGLLPSMPREPCRGRGQEPGQMDRVQRSDPQTGRQPRAGLEGQVQLPKKLTEKRKKLEEQLRSEQ